MRHIKSLSSLVVLSLMATAAYADEALKTGPLCSEDGQRCIYVQLQNPGSLIFTPLCAVSKEEFDTERGGRIMKFDEDFSQGEAVYQQQLVKARGEVMKKLNAGVPVLAIGDNADVACYGSGEIITTESPAEVPQGETPVNLP